MLHMHAILFCSLKRKYISNHKYVQLPAAVLPLLIIPFRVTTTWCASTGNGYCVDPTILSDVDAANATNLTLDINLPCITASSVQWIIASLAYMANAFIVLEFLALYRYYYWQLCIARALYRYIYGPFYCPYHCRTTGVYLMIIRRIFVQDMLKFSVIFVIALHIFVGSFYLALRAGVTVNMSTGAITSDLEVFRLQTL